MYKSKFTSFLVRGNVEDTSWWHSHLKKQAVSGSTEIVIDVVMWLCASLRFHFSRFFRQYLLLCLVHLMSSSMFRAIAGLCRTQVVANTGGTLALLIIVMLGGFIIPRQKIKSWWIWGYWGSPLAYAENAITVNEFLAPRWATVSYICFTHHEICCLQAQFFLLVLYWIQ